MARKQHTYNYIYKTTCLVTGRYYIGMHSTSNIDDGYLGSGKKLWRSIKKHGRENHIREILEFLPDRKSLNLRESEIVTDVILTDSLCMNLVRGGHGGIFNAEHLCKMRKGASAWMKQMWTNDDYRLHISELSSNRLEEKHKKGMMKYDTFNGKSHTFETKKKMSNSQKIAQLGSKNSQFGTCWITNGFENKKINKGDLVPEGWKLGRKMKKI